MRPPNLLQRIVPPILASFTDQDSRVRYYAIESLWNVVRVVLFALQGCMHHYPSPTLASAPLSIAGWMQCTGCPCSYSCNSVC